MWTKDWSFSFSISPSSEYGGLLFFRIDLVDLLEVQGTLKSLLQNHSSEASVLQLSAFFMVQLSHPYLTTGKTIALTIHTFVSKVMSLLFKTQSRFVITFLLRRKHLLCLRSLSSLTLEPQIFHCFPIYLPWSDGTGCHYLHFLNIEFVSLMIFFS